jgi:hypothetical protein
VCEPLTIAAASAMVASAAVKGYSEYTAGQSEAKVADANAQLAERGAADALQRGAAEAGGARAKGDAVASEQKVALAANGVDVSSGSAPNLFATTSSAAELDALTARNNAAKRAWGYDVEAESQRVRATMARRRSVLGPLGTALGTAGSIAGMKSLGGGGAPSASDWSVDG